MVAKKYFTLLSIVLLTTLAAGKHHKKKPSGSGGFFSFPDLSNILKFAFKNFGSEYEEEHFDNDDDDEVFDCDHFGGYGGKGHKGHKHHRFHKEKKIVYKPYFLMNDYSGQAGYSHNNLPGYYASSYTTYIPMPQEQPYAGHASHATQIAPANFDHLDNYNQHEPLYLR